MSSRFARTDGHPSSCRASRTDQWDLATVRVTLRAASPLSLMPRCAGSATRCGLGMRACRHTNKNGGDLSGRNGVKPRSSMESRYVGSFNQPGRGPLGDHAGGRHAVRGGAGDSRSANGADRPHGGTCSFRPHPSRWMNRGGPVSFAWCILYCVINQRVLACHQERMTGDAPARD